MDDAISDETFADTWKRPAGIFVLVVVKGPAGERIRDIQSRFDPKLAATNPPHLTLVGSSGVGPITAGTSVDEMRARIEPIARTIPPLSLQFSAPHKFMQREIVVLPLEPHGPLRDLHERIARSGLSFERAKFTFTPHVTLNFFRTLAREELRQLLAERVEEPLLVDHLRFSLTDDPLPTRDLFELMLSGG